MPNGETLELYFQTAMDNLKDERARNAVLTATVGDLLEACELFQRWIVTVGPGAPKLSVVAETILIAIFKAKAKGH